LGKKGIFSDHTALIKNIYPVADLYIVVVIPDAYHIVVPAVLYRIYCLDLLITDDPADGQTSINVGLGPLLTFPVHTEPEQFFCTCQVTADRTANGIKERDRIPAAVAKVENSIPQA